MIKKWKQLAHGESCELCGGEAAMAPRPVDPSRRRLDGDVHWTNHDHLQAPSLETITRQPTAHARLCCVGVTVFDCIKFGLRG